MLLLMLHKHASQISALRAEYCGYKSSAWSGLIFAHGKPVEFCTMGY